MNDIEYAKEQENAWTPEEDRAITEAMRSMPAGSRISDTIKQLTQEGCKGRSTASVASRWYKTILPSLDQDLRQKKRIDSWTEEEDQTLIDCIKNAKLQGKTCTSGFQEAASLLSHRTEASMRYRWNSQLRDRDTKEPRSKSTELRPEFSEEAAFSESICCTEKPASESTTMNDIVSMLKSYARDHHNEKSSHLQETIRDLQDENAKLRSALNKYYSLFKDLSKMDEIQSLVLTDPGEGATFYTASDGIVHKKTQ